MQPRNLIVAVLLGIALAVGLFLAIEQREHRSAPLTATVLPAPKPLPDVQLVDQDGREVDTGVFRGQWDLVFFGFTHCPDVCPLTLQTLARAQSRLEAAGQDPLPRIVLVSVDPERDTPEQLARYVASFGDGHVGLTGDLAELRTLTDALGIYFARVGDDPVAYTVDHSSVVLLVDPNGAMRALFSSPHTAKNYVHDLPGLLR